MDISYKKYFPNTPFHIETHPIQNTPGTWNSTRVDIYRRHSNDPHDVSQIGSYIRNYSSGSHKTFYPFRIDEEWYALYSAHYTATRVMKLGEHSVEDWCGESPSSGGFCPGEFYVPQALKMTSSIDKDTYEYYLVDCDYSEEEFRDEKLTPGFIETVYPKFGFIAGCVWGDDSSWKLRHIDLSKVTQKVLNITEQFGYFELPNTLSLRQCINMDSWEPDHDWVTLIRAEHYNVSSGEKS